MKMTIGRRIGFGYACAIVVLVALVALSFFGLQRVLSRADVMDVTNNDIADLGHLVAAVEQSAAAVRGYLLTGDSAILSDYTNAQAEIKLYESHLVAQFGQDAAKRDALGVLTRKVGQHLALMAAEVDAQAKGDAAKAVAEIKDGSAEKLLDETRGAAQAIVLMLDRELEEDVKAEAATVWMVKTTMLGGALVVTLLLIWLGIKITRGITGPVGSLIKVADRVAKGEIEVELGDAGREDEIGQLVSSFERMIEYLREMAGVAGGISRGDLTTRATPRSPKDALGNAFADMIASLRRQTQEILDGVGVLATSTGEISTTVSQLASSATEAASSMSETTTTVEEVKKTAEVSRDKARIVAEGARETARVSQSGEEAVRVTVESMARIRTQVEAVAANMVKLSEQSQSIAGIIATVDDIAEQSNLLAVNAAIEAAKAGEHGKGFAVVAQEVKNLAEQSKQATAQVRGILNDIQRATGAAVMATEQAGNAVGAGAVQSGKAGEAIQALAQSIRDAAEASAQIAASTHQQFVGVDQVTAAMENIKQAGDQNVEGIRQLETAARNLNLLGQSLRDLVGRYKV